MFNLTNEIQKSVAKANGRRKSRTLGKADVEIFFDTLNANSNDPKVNIIRRYSGEGFIPNNYKWAAEISFLQATRDAETGQWNIAAHTTDAKRSHGNGALTTINGRGIKDSK